VPVLLVWLHRVRRNADVPGRVHRWSPRWVVGMWFVPVLDLWAPYQAVADIAAAGAPESHRGEVTRQVLAWWLSWLVGLAATAASVRVRGKPCHVRRARRPDRGRTRCRSRGPGTR
jgi:hypothetical protein